MDCDESLEDCRLAIVEIVIGKGNIARHITGVIVSLNALIPAILWQVWRRPNSNLSKIKELQNNTAYFYGW